MILGPVFDLLFGVPLSLGKEILVRLRDEIDRERLITEESIKKRIQELQLLLQEGELGEEQYEELEAHLMERLRAARGYQSQRG